YPDMLNFGGFSTTRTPTIDPIGNRYFIISSSKLWSIDLNTGNVLNSYNINGDSLWYMQYNISDNALYGINKKTGTSEYYLGKFDLNTGLISSYPVMLPSNFGGFSTTYTPTIDPIGNRYFIISSSKLWSIDLNTG